MAAEYYGYIAELEPEHSIVLLGNEESIERIGRTLIASTLGNAASDSAEDLQRVNELTAALDGPRNSAGQLVLSGVAETIALMAVAERGIDTLCEDYAAMAKNGQLTIDEYRAAYTSVYNLPTLSVVTRDGLCGTVDVDCIDPAVYPLEDDNISDMAREVTPKQLGHIESTDATHYALQMELVEDEQSGRVELLSERQHRQIGMMDGEDFVPIATLLDAEHPVMIPQNPEN